MLIFIFFEHFFLVEQDQSKNGIFFFDPPKVTCTYPQNGIFFLFCFTRTHDTPTQILRRRWVIGEGGDDLFIYFHFFFLQMWVFMIF